MLRQGTQTTAPRQTSPLAGSSPVARVNRNVRLRRRKRQRNQALESRAWCDGLIVFPWASPAFVFFILSFSSPSGHYLYIGLAPRHLAPPPSYGPILLLLLPLSRARAEGTRSSRRTYSCGVARSARSLLESAPPSPPPSHSAAEPISGGRPTRITLSPISKTGTNTRARRERVWTAKRGQQRNKNTGWTTTRQESGKYEDRGATARSTTVHRSRCLCFAMSSDKNSRKRKVQEGNPRVLY